MEDNSEIKTITPKPPTPEEFTVISANINSMPDLPTKNKQKAMAISWGCIGMFIGSIVAFVLGAVSVTTVVTAGALAYLGIMYRGQCNIMSRTLLYAVMMHQTVQGILDTTMELINKEEKTNADNKNPTTEVR